jgi:hypothetical protein
VTRPAPVGPQLAAFLSTAVGGAKGAATNHNKSDQAATSKRPAQFSSLLGSLVEKKEKSSIKPAETLAVPFATAPPVPPPPPKQELPARGLAFGSGESGGDPLPLQSSMQSQTSLDGIQPLLTARAHSPVVPAASDAGQKTGDQRPPNVPSAAAARAADSDSDLSIHNSSTSEQLETPASSSPVALLGNGFPPITAACDLNPQTGLQDISPLEESSESGPQPPTGAGSTRSQLTPSTEKPVLSKAKISAGGFGEHLAQSIDARGKQAASSQIQSQPGEPESGGSGGDHGANETSGQSGQSAGANAPQSKPGEAPQPGSLAFAARLVPLPETSLIAGNPGGSAQSASAGSGGQGEAGGSHPSNGATPEVSKDSPKSGPAADAQPGATPSSSPSEPVPLMPQTAAGQIQNNSSSETRPANNSSPLPAAKDVQGAQSATGVQPAAASPARDIHLQLNQGEQRVDVRLSERSGEVHVAVRTPDPQLAGALRDDLPRLSDHLEASGFRTETWHAGLPGTLSGGERRLEAAESSFSQPQDGGQRQTGQRDPQQQQQQPRQPKPGTAQNSNSQRKDFQWLMSQLP